MRTALNKCALLLALCLVLAGLIGFFLWRDRPLALDPAQLALSDNQRGLSSPEAELALDIRPGRIDLSLTNLGRESLFSGASVGSENRLFTGGEIEVLLNGRWYQVPQERYASAGVGIELGPGESFQAEVFLNPARRLPDGQYRFSFGYQYGERLLRHISCARFDVARGRYVQPAG